MPALGTAFLGNLGNLAIELGLTAFATMAPSAVIITGGSLTGVSVAATTLSAASATVSGPLNVTGAATLASLGVGGSASVGGTLVVTGASTLSSLTTGGAVSVGTNLAVLGTSTFTGNITAGNITSTGSVQVGALTTGSAGSLYVGGATTLAGAVTLTGPTLTAYGPSLINSTLTTTAYITANTTGAQFLGRGWFHYSDSATYYLMLTGTQTPTTTYTAQRAFFVSLSTGYVGMNQGVGIVGGLTTDALASGAANFSSSVNVNAYLAVNGGNRLYLKGSSSGVFQIYDDANAHLESDTMLWINQLSANPVTIGSGGGLTTIGAALSVIGTATLSAGMSIGGAISGTLSTAHVLAGLTLNSDLIVNGGVYAPQIKAIHTTTGGGTITFDASGNFSWSNRFIVMNAGNSPQFSTIGFFDISMPASGSVVTGYNGASSYTMTSTAIIPIPAWQTLYYIMPIGAGNTSNPSNFALVGYGSGSFNVPANWLPLATRSGDSGKLSVLGHRYSLAPGDVMDTTQFRTGIYTPQNYGIGGALTVTGNSTLGGSLSAGSTSVVGTLAVSGAGGILTINDQTSTGATQFFRSGKVVYLYDTTYGNNLLTFNATNGTMSVAGPALFGSAVNVASIISTASSVNIGNNGTGSTNKLYLSGAASGANASDLNHYIYSTGAGGNSMFFGEYSGAFNFYNTATSVSDITFRAGSITASGNMTLGGSATVISATVNGILTVYNGGTSQFYGPVVLNNTLTVTGLISATGGINIPGYNTNGLYPGNGDGASYTVYDLNMKLWWGLGMTTYDGTCHGYYDARAGIWDTAGGYQVNGTQFSDSARNITVSSVLSGGAITSNASTSFVANGGDSSVALVIPSNAIIRNNSASASTMYFDVSFGGASHGQWIWRSSNTGATRMQLDIGGTLYASGAVVAGGAIYTAAGSGVVINTNQMYAPSGPLYLQYSNATGGVNICTNGGVTNIGGPLTVSGTITATGNVNTSGLFAAGTVFTGNGSINSYGAWLQWNRGNGDGATYLVNQKGGGSGGVFVGESDTSNNYAHSARFYSNSAYFAGSLSIGLNGNSGSGSIYSDVNWGMYLVGLTNAAIGHFSFRRYDGYELARIDTAGTLSVYQGNLNIQSGLYYCQTTGAQFCAPGYMLYSDGSYMYILLTGANGAGQATTGFNGYRPFYINLANGAVGMQNGLNVSGGLNVDNVTVTGSIKSPGTAKAWVIFNNQGTISGSFGVSSVTVTSGGYYTINFPSGTFPDTNYAYASAVMTDTRGVVYVLERDPGFAKTATAIQFTTVYSNSGYSGTSGTPNEMSIVFYHT